MQFNYEQSIWGRGTASLRWSDPAAFRLQRALTTISGFKADAKVLEVGCGAGQFIRAVKKQRPELICFGCDISREAIQISKNQSDKVIYAMSDPYRFPYNDGAMDAVLIFDVLEHVDDPLKLLTEVRRVLKRGGLLYAFVPCEGDWLSWWHLLDILHLKKDLTRKHAGHIQYFSRKQLDSLCVKAGLVVKEKRYSEHVVGQLLGIVAFMGMDRAACRQGVAQINNETYFASQRQSLLIKLIKNIVNCLVYLESILLARVPSPNVHIAATKGVCHSRTVSIESPL